MPNSAYTRLTESFGFCPNAVVISNMPVSATATIVTITGLSASFANPIRVGMGAMIDDEFVIVDAIDGSQLTLLRGCADTIPQYHYAGSRIWFIEDSLVRVPRELAASETVSLKILPRTSAGVMPIESSPPLEVTTNFRFARPYPPGQVRVNNRWWYEVGTLLTESNPMQVTWAHRNRITQADMLVHHDVGSIAPEAGTVYLIDIFRTSTGTQIASYQTTDATFTYTVDNARADLQGLLGFNSMYLTLRCMRDNLMSRGTYRIDFLTLTVTDDGLMFNKAKNSQYLALRTFGVN